MMMFKDRPLARSGNTLYYGHMAQKYVALLQILATEKIHGIDVAQKVSIQLLSTDPDLTPKERIIKKAEKDGLYSALNIADIWLTRYLNQ